MKMSADKNQNDENHIHLAIGDLEKKIGHVFTDRLLIRKALTHSSTGAKKNYERLEFLGDRVLGLVIAEELFTRFPNEAEGDLAKRLAALVQGDLIASVAREIKLGVHIDFSEAERAAGGADNDNILADVFEAMIGALYMDAGLEKCNAFIKSLWGSRFNQMIKPPQHPKTSLQEWAQSKGLGLPEYKIVGQHGPDHAPIFDIEVHLEGFKPIQAEGRSRQLAEKEAATAFLKFLKQQKKL